jgi:glutamine synthetase
LPYDPAQPRVDRLTQCGEVALIRIPRYTPGLVKATRMELAFQAMLAAALDGVDSQRPVPGPLNNINIYELTPEQRQEQGIGELPGSLLEALNDLEKDEVLKKALGPVMYEAFRRAKLEEWEDYRIKVTDWEVSRYLETA